MALAREAVESLPVGPFQLPFILFRRAFDGSLECMSVDTLSCHVNCIRQLWLQ